MATTPQFGLYRSSETLSVSGTMSKVTWDRTDREDAPFDIQVDETDVEVSDGDDSYLLASYAQNLDGGGTNVRKSVAMELQVEDASSPYGHAVAFTRNTTTGFATEMGCTALTILKVDDDDHVSVAAEVISDNTSDVDRTADQSSFELMPLPSGIEIFRAYRSTDYPGASSDIGNTYDTIPFNVADDRTTAVFSAYSTSTGALTINTTGRFLVLVNLVFESFGGTGERIYPQARVTYNGSVIEGGEVDGYIRNTNGCLRESLQIYRVIDVTTSGRDLEVEARWSARDAGTVSAKLRGNECSIAVIRLHDEFTVATARLNNDADNGNADLEEEIGFNDQIVVDALAFSHDESTNNERLVIESNDGESFLLMGNVAIDRQSGGGNRIYHRGIWRQDGTTNIQRGSSMTQTRGDADVDHQYSTLSCSVMMPAVDEDTYFELRHRNETTNTDSDAQFDANRTYLAAIHLDGLFQTKVEARGRSLGSEQGSLFAAGCDTQPFRADHVNETARLAMVNAIDVTSYREFLAVQSSVRHQQGDDSLLLEDCRRVAGDHGFYWPLYPVKTTTSGFRWDLAQNGTTPATDRTEYATARDRVGVDNLGWYDGSFTDGNSDRYVWAYVRVEFETAGNCEGASMAQATATVS